VSETQAAHRIYYDEPDRLEFTAEVTAIRELARVDGRQVWQIALDQTAFYPTSGGQPHDIGTLNATSRSGAQLEVPVSSVEEDDTGEVWHTTHKPLQEGTTVRGAIDAARRRDHMQQHTGQHLLSAFLQRDFGLKTVSFHLGADDSTIDLDGDLTNEQLTQAEQTANELIRVALPVSIRTVSQQDAETMLAAGTLRKLPPRLGPIRIIEIAGIDVNACGGTHVSNTAQIAPLLLRGTERMRGGTRLTFLCGERAIAAARADHQRLALLAQSLSTSVDEVGGNVARLQADSKAAAKQHAAQLGAMASLHAESLAASGSIVVHSLDPQQPGSTAEYAKLLASRLISSTPAVVALIIAPEPERASVVLASKPGGIDCGTLLRTLLAAHNGRGGGTREIAQGALPLGSLAAWQDSLSAQLNTV
jgi:alanyl-tRNA synthetase